MSDTDTTSPEPVEEQQQIIQAEPTPEPPKGRQTAETWRDQDVKAEGAPRLRGFSADGRYRIAKVFHGWPIGKLVTREEYDSAVAEAMSSPIGSNKRHEAKAGAEKVPPPARRAGRKA